MARYIGLEIKKCLEWKTKNEVKSEVTKTESKSEGKQEVKAEEEMEVDSDKVKVESPTKAGSSSR